MIISIIVLVLFVVAGISNAICDTLMFRYEDSVFKKWKTWNPNKSWLNKWEMIDRYVGPFKCTSNPWYYLWLYRPKYIERFPYSSTVLVFLTDPWHFFKFVMLTCFESSVVLIVLEFTDFKNVWLFALGVTALKVVRGLAFTLVFDFLFLKRD